MTGGFMSYSLDASKNIKNHANFYSTLMLGLIYHEILVKHIEFGGCSLTDFYLILHHTNTEHMCHFPSVKKVKTKDMSSPANQGRMKEKSHYCFKSK